MLKREPIAATALNSPPMNCFPLRLVPLSSDWVIANLCSYCSIWVMTSLFQCVPAQGVSLAVVCTFFLPTISGLNLTKTLWVCKRQLVINNPGCSFRTITPRTCHSCMTLAVKCVPRSELMRLGSPNREKMWFINR